MADSGCLEKSNNHDISVCSGWTDVDVAGVVTRYMVQVETGDTNDFDPIHGVYIVLYGTLADSGLRYLSKSKEGGLLFELFKVYTHTVYSLDLSLVSRRHVWGNGCNQ